MSRGRYIVPPRCAAKIRRALSEHFWQGSFHFAGQTNTSSIAYASYRIKACCPQANIVVVPSDQLVLKEYEFLEAVRKSLDFVANHRALVTRPRTSCARAPSASIAAASATIYKV